MEKVNEQKATTKPNVEKPKTPQKPLIEPNKKPGPGKEILHD